MPNNNLKQLIENTIKSEVKKNSFVPVIWNSDLEITPFTTEQNKKYATIINRRTVRLISYEFTSNEENEIKITSVEEFPTLLTKEQALEKAKKIEFEIKEQDKLISIEQEEEPWQTVQLTSQEQTPIITEQTDNLKIQQEIYKLKNDNEVLKKENEELKKNQSDLVYYSEKVKQIAELEKKIEQLEKELLELRNQVNAAKEEMNSLETKLERKEQEIKDLRIERDKLVKQLTIYQEITNSIKTKKKELEKLKQDYVKGITFSKKEIAKKLETFLDAQAAITRDPNNEFAKKEKRKAEDYLNKKANFTKLIELSKKQAELVGLELRLEDLKKYEISEGSNKEFQAQLGDREKEIIDKTSEFLAAKKNLLTTRQETIEELQKCLNELEKAISEKKRAAIGEMGKVISNTGEAVGTITFGVPRAVGEAIIASNNFSKIKLSKQSSEQFKVSLEDDQLSRLNNSYDALISAVHVNKKLATSAEIVRILGLENRSRREEANLFSAKYRIYDVLIKDGIWKGRTLTPEKMEAAIKSLSSNLDELRNELIQEEKQFEEFSSQLEQTKQQLQSQILQQTNLPYGTSSSSK